MKRILTSVFLRLARALGVTDVQQRLDKVEQAVFLGGSSPLVDHVERRINDHFGAGAVHFDDRLVGIRNEFASEVSRLRLSIDAMRQSSVTRVVDGRSSANSNGDSDHLIDDALYVSLENHFRGSRDVIADRQSNYLGKLPLNVSEDAPVIDLGCGRGEWLGVLSDRGIPALGVDSNSVCIRECTDRSFSVVESDLLDFLRSRGESSVGAYTMFQVLEHLPFPVLLECLRHVRRTLVPGGRLIAEVPNARNLRVSAGTFWIDPTHVRPLFPDLLVFLAEEVGFVSAEGLYVNDESPKFDLSSLQSDPREALARLLDAIDTAGDFALIATA